MGILNVTPDSFSDGGQYFNPQSAIKRGLEIAAQGASIIDIGGESTRPGSVSIGVEEETKRVVPVITELSKKLDIPISIDTTRSIVAEEALKAGASMVNDISGLTSDREMPALISQYKASVVINHIQGLPESMQNKPQYKNLIEEIIAFLNDAVKIALSAGIAKDKIIIDPGIGFGKALEDNYRIINNLDLFKRLGYPVLIGLSRKSLIGKINGESKDRLPATLALNSVAIQNGADIIRVHDVEEHRLAVECLSVLEKVS